MKLEKSSRIKWACTFFIPLLLAGILNYNHVDRTMTLFFTITLIGILMFLFEQVHMVVTSILLMSAYVIFGIAPMSVVFSGWMQESIWITFGCLVLVLVLGNTTLVERITFHLILLSGGTYKGILFALIGLGIIINLLVPGVMVGVMIAALAYSLCQTLELGRSKASAGIMIGALCVGFYDVELFILSPGNYTLITNSAKSIIDLNMNYWIYFRDNWIFIPFVFIEAIILNKMFAPKEMGNFKEKFQIKLKALGEISFQEKKLISVLIILFLYLILQPLHNLSMWYGFIIAPAILFFPGFDLGKKENIEKVNYSILIFMVACLGIGYTAVYLGLGDSLADWAVQNLNTENPSSFIGSIYLLAVSVNFLMTPFAAMSSLGGTLAKIASSVGVSFYPITYAFFSGCQTIIFPYESALYAILYGFGNMRLKDFVKFMLIRACLMFVYLIVIGTSYWKLLGYL